jgi:NADH dehydrogenase [ubiquinone] 1 alpha subcomplex assembly factor 7
MTPLEVLISELIATDGPMRLDHYMGLCLGHPQHGYYVTRDPLGREGDFVTAPEVSQVFGELIGIWAAGAFVAMGEPARVNLVELGPGRGTLMADMLRTIGRVSPALAAAAVMHLVETSPVLRTRQRQAVGPGASWHMTLKEVPQGPMILVANEFFDAIPIRQIERRHGLWHERVIGLEQGRLARGLSGPVLGPEGRDGDVLELAPARDVIASQIGQRLSRHAGAALIIDYGHLTSAPGDTLQAMRRHGFADVTERPGECDLTSHVDFQALGRALTEGGADILRPMTQRDFLLAMGLEQRFQRLELRADLLVTSTLRRQMARLADENQMGNLFKVLAATSPGMPCPYPFGQT